jgi:hypothetical protein
MQCGFIVDNQKGKPVILTNKSWPKLSSYL